MTSYGAQPVILNRLFLLKVNWTNAKLIAILCLLGLSSIRPAQANLPQQQRMLQEELPAAEGNNHSQLKLAQLPNFSQAQTQQPIPPGFTPGQYPNLPPNTVMMAIPATAVPVNPGNYNAVSGQYPNYPQIMIIMPVPATAVPVNSGNYNAVSGQYPNLPPNTVMMAVPNPGNYNALPGQYPNLPPAQAPLPPPLPTSTANPGNYNAVSGQYPNLPPAQAPLPESPVALNSNNSTSQIEYDFRQTQQVLPNTAEPNLAPSITAPTTQLGQELSTQEPFPSSTTPVNSPSLDFQGTYVTQGDQSVARARLSGLYPLTPRVLLGATIDLTSEDNELADSPEEGLNINELYVATAPVADLPNLRFVVGQLDLTSYFDRNSFAKDGVTHFFNPVFQTNPALSATGILSRPGFLVNWTANDNLEAKAAVFSSSRNLGDFSLDGFAGEVGVRSGNAIIRGTYATAKDAGSDSGFQEIFSVPRGDDQFGLLSGDREESYGINAEVFVPDLNMGIFGRYGRYENRDLDQGGDTYSLGLSFLDVFSPDDRLGLAYGRNLSNETLRQENGDEVPDVWELFYDFRFAPNLRLGFTLQQRDGFSDTYAGFRVKTEFNIIPRRRLTP
ncbi:hypothetical protein [Lyngbya aestuarii]|uniref:hypothetical protein n=1 Tax=Lyngbya aestuarii TaxID=118322 RepID=UPI00403D9D61